MSILTGFKTAPFGLHNTTAQGDKSVATLVGSKWATSDGREFVLVQNGAVALLPGKVVQGPAAQAGAAGLSPATTSTTGYLASLGPIAGVIGGTTIQIATAGTAVLVNRFAGGYLNVVEGTGLGQTLKIASNSAAATTAAMGVVLEDTFTIATSTDSRFTFTINPYGTYTGTAYTTDGVIVAPATTLTGKILGVAPYVIPASTATVLSYGFIQTKGPIGVLGTDSTALGLMVGLPTGVAGAVSIAAVATTNIIGTCLIAQANTKYNMVDLTL
jgi:hypothetical protein